jgi:4-hydroxy-tetrahydrodipicolinate synthase
MLRLRGDTREGTAALGVSTMGKSGPSSDSASGMRGIIAAAVTPRRAGESTPDLGALLEVVDFLCSAGVNGTVLFGSTGEFPVFEAVDRARAVSLAVKRSRCPVYANVSHATLDTAILLAEQAADAGVAGVLVMPPVYFRYDQETVREYLAQLFDAVARWTPVYLYNIPQFASAIEPKTAAGLLTHGFSGIKDSSGSWEYFEELIGSPAARGKSVLVGSEMLYGDARAAGAAGAVSGVAACMPELMVALDRALALGDQAASRALLARVEEFLAWYREFPAPVAIKEAANLRGLKAGVADSPLGPEKNKRLEEFRRWFGEWHRGVIRECGVSQSRKGA